MVHTVISEDGKVPKGKWEQCVPKSDNVRQREMWLTEDGIYDIYAVGMDGHIIDSNNSSYQSPDYDQTTPKNTVKGWLAVHIDNPISYYIQGSDLNQIVDNHNAAIAAAERESSVDIAAAAVGTGIYSAVEQNSDSDRDPIGDTPALDYYGEA